MDLFNNKFRVPSTRLPDFDYGEIGYYFITICTKNRINWFGRVIGGKMVLNDAGLVVKKCWDEINHIFPYALTDEYAIMPNHFHGMINIHRKDAIKCNTHCKDAIYSVSSEKHAIICNTHEKDAINRVSTNGKIGGVTKFKNPMVANSLGNIIRRFKGVSTFSIRKFQPNFAWQSRFYDMIIWDELMLSNVRKYIKNNPSNWQNDKNFHM